MRASSATRHSVVTALFPKNHANLGHVKATDPSEKLPPIPDEWQQEFEAASRRSLYTRLRYSFIHTYKPVLDDAPFRAFTTMEEYRAWCETNLPTWLGYGRV